MSVNIQAIRKIISELNNPKVNNFDGHNPYPYDVKGSQIYLDRVNSILSAGLKLVEDRVLSNKQQDAIESLNALKKQAHAKLRILNPENDEEHHDALKMIAELTKQIAEILKEAEKNHYLKNQSNTFVEDWLVELQECDYAIISSGIRRPIVNIYPDGQGGTLISVASPLSNVSSLSRKGTPPVLPNFWKVTSIHCDKDGNVISKRNVYRSASLSPFEENDKEKRLSKAKEIAKFELRQYALDRVLELPKNASKEEVLKALSYDFLNLSIQSTLFAEKRSIQEGFNTYQDIQKLANEGQLLFSPGQLVAINRRFPHVKLNESEAKIRPNIIFFNLGTNMMRGDDPKGYQGKLNKKAKIELQNLVVNKLKNVHEIVGILAQKNPIDKHSLKMIDEYIERNQSSEHLKETIKTLRIFSNYAHFNRKGQPTALEEHARNSSKNNYMQQEAVIELAEHLGLVVKGNCQSGKDRTGMLFAAIEAAQIQRDLQHQPGAIDKNAFWEKHLPNCVNYTTGREITTVNCPGAKGLQGMTYELIVPSGFREAIHAKMQDRASRLHKAPYIGNKGKVSNDKGEATKSVVAMEAKNHDSPVLRYKEVVQHLKQIQEVKDSPPRQTQKSAPTTKVMESVAVLTQHNSSINELNQFLAKPGNDHKYHLWAHYYQDRQPNKLILDVGEDPFKLTKVTIEESRIGENSNLNYSLSKSIDQDRMRFAMETTCKIAINAAKQNAVITLSDKFLDEYTKQIIFKVIHESGRQDLKLQTSKGDVIPIEKGFSYVKKNYPEN